MTFDPQSPIINSHTGMPERTKGHTEQQSDGESLAGDAIDTNDTSDLPVGDPLSTDASRPIPLPREVAEQHQEHSDQQQSDGESLAGDAIDTNDTSDLPVGDPLSTDASRPIPLPREVAEQHQEHSDQQQSDGESLAGDALNSNGTSQPEDAGPNTGSTKTDQLSIALEKIKSTPVIHLYPQTTNPIFDTSKNVIGKYEDYSMDIHDVIALSQRLGAPRAETTIKDYMRNGSIPSIKRSIPGDTLTKWFARRQPAEAFFARLSDDEKRKRSYGGSQRTTAQPAINPTTEEQPTSSENTLGSQAATSDTIPISIDKYEELLALKGRVIELENSNGLLDKHLTHANDTTRTLIQLPAFTEAITKMAKEGGIDLSTPESIMKFLGGEENK